MAITFIAHGFVGRPGSSSADLVWGSVMQPQSDDHQGQNIQNGFIHMPGALAPLPGSPQMVPPCV